MNNPFKRKNNIEQRHVLSGKVRFIKDRAIKEGEVFGKPFSVGMFDRLTYHIFYDGKIYDVKEDAVESL